jgi:hypothetical protein
MNISVGRAAAAGLARATLQTAYPPPATLRLLIEICRRAGALEEAWLLLDRLHEMAPIDPTDALLWLRA